MMTKKGHKYIFEIISNFFSNRYEAELEEDIQRWIIDDTFSEEKEAVIQDVWENLAVGADESTYVSLQKIQKKLGIQHKQERASLFSFSRVAAILIPLFFIIGGYYLFLHKSISMTELSASYGEITEKVLSDGTEVWINSGSTITFDKNFKASERIVALNGEACFDVEKHRSKPFVVKTAHLNIRVLGTQLNIRAFSDEGRNVITLATGAVSIEAPNGKSYEIRPDQQLIYYNATSEVTIEDVAASDFMRWRSGLLLFDDARFNEIISDIERHYNVKIVIDDNISVPNDIYTIKFVNQESLDRALAILYELIGGFSYTISDDGSTIHISKPEIAPIQQEDVPESVTETPYATDSVALSCLVSIDRQEMSFRDIFEQIESQIGYTVGFNQSKFDAYRTVTGISYTEADFRDVLTDILDESGFTYKVEGNHILITEESGLQAISGYIFDFESGWPVTNASITWGSNNRRTRTDRNGYFSIEHLKPGSYSINISALGYHSGSRKVALVEGGDGSTLKIHLSEAVPVVSNDDDYNATVTNNESPSITTPFQKSNRTHFVIKSNLIYLFGTYTPNIALEFALSNRFSIDMQVGYNPFTLSNGRQFKHTLLQPELRFWPTYTFDKHFFGLHTLYGVYDVSKQMRSKVYDGNMVGTGISYGYNYRIGQRWALEATIGIGYVMLNYKTAQFDEYPVREEISDRYEMYTKERYNYFGITKLGVSITYKIR